MRWWQHRAIDGLRRRKLIERKHQELGHALEARPPMDAADLDLDDDIGEPPPCGKWATGKARSRS